MFQVYGISVWSLRFIDFYLAPLKEIAQLQVKPDVGHANNIDA